MMTKREELVAAAPPENRRTINAICDLRQRHLPEFSSEGARTRGEQ